MLVCRPRPADAAGATRRELITALKRELLAALVYLQRGNIAPVDLAKAAIGPGMAVYTRFSRVLDAAGRALTVREALALINWEMVHHLIRVLEAGGERAAAELVARLGTRAESVCELCYRLYTVCERKKRAAEALAYNSLVQSWPEIVRLAEEQTRHSEQSALFDERED